jgi:hypothetical protein
MKKELMYCDICGKLINKGEGKCNLAIYDKHHNHSFTFDDMCTDCTKQIEDMLVDMCRKGSDHENSSVSA